MAVEVPQKAEQDAGEHGFGGKAAQVFKGPGDVLGVARKQGGEQIAPEQGERRDDHANARAHLVTVVERMDSRLNAMAKESSGSGMGTGGMATKLRCAKIATVSGADMVIASGADPEIIYKILEGEECGTLFLAHKDEEFRLTDYI